MKNNDHRKMREEKGREKPLYKRSYGLIDHVLCGAHLYERNRVHAEFRKTIEKQTLHVKAYLWSHKLVVIFSFFRFC